MGANRCHVSGALVICAVAFASTDILAADSTAEVEALKRQVESQQKELNELRQLVEKLLQQQPSIVVEDLTDDRQSDEVTVESTDVDPKVEESHVAAADVPWGRDPVGDMRSGTVRRGEFPASIKIMGRGDIPVDLAIAGFVKTIAFWDNNNERDDEYFLPALFGFGSTDADGQFKTSADLSRLFLDARSDVGPGNLRAYVEWEFRNDFNLRHAYGDWSGEYGQLKAGQYWSNFMDLGALPESVIEPLVSGAGFARQTQIKYTTPPVGDFWFAFSVEDPSSNDVVTDDSPLTSQPDYIGTVQWNITDAAHWQWGAVWRDIELRSGEFEDRSTDGWGIRTAGAWRITPNNKILGGLTYGDGIGRYMLGLDPVSGGYIGEGGELKSRKAQGAFASYQYRFDDQLRFNLTTGFAEADDDVNLSGDQFESTTYFATNIFYEISPYLVVSGEYNWGERENLDGSDLDDHRVTVGMQLF